MTLAERQLPLTGLELRDQGIASLERHRWVDDARSWAERICDRNGTVTSDDIHALAAAMDPLPHDNCYGAIFKGTQFVATGERVKSTRPEARARWIQVWRLA